LTVPAIMDILNNRFYEGKVIYNKGLPDEKVFDGKHEVPDEVRDLWLRCQVVKKERSSKNRGSVKALIAKIEQFVIQYNRTSHPFVWTATADSILEKVRRLCQCISETGH
jgi:hypothetical protein